MKQAQLYKKLARKQVLCTACSWYCRIDDQKVGLCATRLNRRGVLYSLVYGQAIGLHADPVEKKPLFHFLPASRLLSFGTLGCSFGCVFCQNWEMSQLIKNERLKVKDQNLEERLTRLIELASTPVSPQQIVKMALVQGSQGIAYTYNEPAIFAEFAHDTARLAKKEGLKNVFVSNGFESEETFSLMKDCLDAINIDLKSFSPEFYLRICKSRIEPVKENIRRSFEAGLAIEVTTLLIPGHNDSEEELTQIAKFLAKISSDIPWHLSAFYPAYQMMDLPPTTHQTLVKAYSIGKEVGLKYVYLGNIADEKRSSTYCPTCKELLIRRSGYLTEVRKLNLSKGSCANCGENIYGRWK